eukprot:3237898-Prymnesium_polylepis.1
MCGHTRAGVRSTQCSTGHGWVSASGNWPRYARNRATAMATAQCLQDEQAQVLWHRWGREGP